MEIFVLAEHRMGEIRDISYEMLYLGRKLACDEEGSLTAVLLGFDVDGFADDLATRADRVIVVDGTELKDFNAEAYQLVLSKLIKDLQPSIIFIGHTSFGIDLAPSLAVQLSAPLATDCIDVVHKKGKLMVTRQIYGGKINVLSTLRKADRYIVTIRPATFQPEDPGLVKGEINRFDPPSDLSKVTKKFIDYVEPPVGGIDIAEADILVSIGRGIRDEKNIPLVQELAEAMGAKIACSRPIVDKDWLPKDRQVGSSGKTVKPKLYLAAGISGSFQHVMGMKSSELVVAINKDPKAPIFRIADYGVFDDLFKVIPELTQKLKEIRLSSR